MPESQPNTSTPDITWIAAEPQQQPKLLIADILRTRFCVPGSVFLVESVDVVHTSKSGRWRVVRLLLGDGKLCIQALLSGNMHRYVDSGEVAVGSYIRLESFRVEWVATTSETAPETGSSGGKGKEPSTAREDGMVYLVVDDLLMVGWNNKLLNLLGQDERAPRISERYVVQQEAEDTRKQTIASTNPGNFFVPPKVILKPTTSAHPDIPEEVAADADDDFEVMNVTESKAAQNRAQTAVATQRESASYSAPVDANQLPWVSSDPSKPLKLTPLRSIPNLPYKQNWSINVLAVVSAISELEPSALPPFSQRQARLAHPSTSKHVHLTVFLDPDEFAPGVGSVVLLLGVKNHRFDGGSLKKYVSDRPRDGGRWWFEDPVELEWCDVEGLRRWWKGQ